MFVKNVKLDWILICFLTQAIRVVANFSIHHEAGPAIAASQEFIDFLIQILGKAWYLRVGRMSSDESWHAKSFSFVW